DQKRESWVNAVRSTPEGMRSLMEQLSIYKRPLLCKSHFSPSDYTQRENGAFMLRPGSIPSYMDAEDPGETKEVSMDGVSDSKQEELIADVLCPYSGEMLSLNQSAVTTSAVPMKRKTRRLKCVVCGNSCIRAKMRLFTQNQDRRVLWANAVRSSPERRGSFLEQLSIIKTPYLCSSHFSSSDYCQHVRGLSLRPDAIPSFVDSAENSNGVVEMQLFDFETTNEIKEEPIDYFTDFKKEEPFFDNDAIRSSDAPPTKRMRVMQVEEAPIGGRSRGDELGIKEEDEEPIDEPGPSK
ncbi:hypothetical protein PMAYCL1PPCAC_10553, partial [Pristionchus mayeri]